MFRPAEMKGSAVMDEVTELTIGSEVACSDGNCGVLARVVIDPVSRDLTHLVGRTGTWCRARAPRNRSTLWHRSPRSRFRLSSTISEFEALDEAEETQLLPGGDEEWGFEPDQMLSWPYYGLSVGPYGMGGLGSDAGLGMVPLAHRPSPMTEFLSEK